MTSRSLALLAPLSLLAALGCASTKSVSTAQGYHIVKKIPVGQEGGWDYSFADPPSHRVFVSHGTRVMVIDTKRDTVVGEISPTPGVHGIAVAHDLNRGFISNGRDTSVTIFDLNTLAVLSVVKVTGRNPDAIVYDPISHRVFTFNGGTSDATVIDGATGSIAGTIPLGGKPEMGVSDGHGRMFVNIEDTGEIATINTTTLAVESRWSIKPCEEPSGLTLDAKNNRLFAVCGNALMTVVNTDNGNVVTTVPIGQGVDATGFDAERGLVFASNGADGTLTIIKQDGANTYHVQQTLKTERGARTMTLDPTTHRIYLSTAQFGPTPEPTADRPRPRPPMIPGSFAVLVVEP
jgi:DNA-binding beta-propeller fold protein YncE